MHREFGVALAGVIVVFWRKVPMCTLQFYFGKLAAGYCSVLRQLKSTFPTPPKKEF